MDLYEDNEGTWLIPSIDKAETDKSDVLSTLFGGEYAAAVAVSMKHDNGSKTTIGFVLLSSDWIKDYTDNRTCQAISDRIIEYNTFARSDDDKISFDLEDYASEGKIEADYFDLTDTNTVDKLSDIVDSMYLNYNANDKVKIIWAQDFDTGVDFKNALTKEFTKSKKVAQIVRLPNKITTKDHDENVIGFAIFTQGINWQNTNIPGLPLKYNDVVVSEDSTYSNTDFSVDEILTSVLEEEMYDPDEFGGNEELKFYEYLEYYNSEFEGLVETAGDSDNDSGENSGDDEPESSEALEKKAPVVQHIETKAYTEKVNKEQLKNKAVIRTPPVRAKTPKIQTINKTNNSKEVTMTNLFAKFKFQPMNAALTMDGLVAIDINTDPNDAPKYKAVDDDNNVIDVMDETVMMEMPLLMPIMGAKPEIGDYVKQENTWFKIIDDDHALNLSNGTITGLRMTFTQFFKAGVFHRLMVDPKSFLGNGIGMAMMLGGKLNQNGESGIDMKILMLANMMTQQQNGGAANAFGGMNPLMFMLLSEGDKAGSGLNTNTLMLIMSMMGGQNLFGNLLGAPAAAPAKAPAAKSKK